VGHRACRAKDGRDEHDLGRRLLGARLEQGDEGERREDGTDVVDVDVLAQVVGRVVERLDLAGRGDAGDEQEDVDRRGVVLDERNLARGLDSGLRRTGRRTMVSGRLAGWFRRGVGRTAIDSSETTSRVTVSTRPLLSATIFWRSSQPAGLRAAATTRTSVSRASWRTVSSPMPLRGEESS
jgi:hypothetical protein